MLAARTQVLTEIVSPKVLSANAEHDLAPGTPFTECGHCPEMVVVPAGTFMMGAPDGEPGARDIERPQHQVTIAKPFAVSKFEVTFEEWQACYLLGGCATRPSDQGWGRGRRPVVSLTWNEAKQYVAWLSRRTGKPYRLLTEAEWEYAARAGTQTAYSWGATWRTATRAARRGRIATTAAVSRDNDRTAPVGSFAPNAFGLHDVHGNVWEWVEDCYQDSYEGAPTNGSAFLAESCPHRVLRGGSWYNGPRNIRSASRYYPRPRNVHQPEDVPSTNDENIGLRVAER